MDTFQKLLKCSQLEHALTCCHIHLLYESMHTIELARRFGHRIKTTIFPIPTDVPEASAAAAASSSADETDHQTCTVIGDGEWSNIAKMYIKLKRCYNIQQLH